MTWDVVLKVSVLMGVATVLIGVLIITWKDNS